MTREMGPADDRAETLVVIALLALTLLALAFALILGQQQQCERTGAERDCGPAVAGSTWN